MSTPQAEELLTAEAQTAIITHMNKDHQQHILEYVHWLKDIRNAVSAVMTKVDNKGFNMDVTLDNGQTNDVRLDFPREIATRLECRKMMIELVGEANKKKQATSQN